MVVKNLAGNVTATSSGSGNFSGNFSAQTGVPPMDHKPTFSTISATPIAPGIPSDTSDASSSSSSTITFTRLPLPQLRQEDYQNIKHWFEDKYKSHRKHGRKGIEDAHEDVKGSILSSFMEDENGNRVSKKQRDAARERARRFFSLLLDKGRAPPVWGDASFDVSNELTHILESHFPWTRLCDDHWKATMIATNSYSQWIKGARKRRAEAAGNVIDVDATNGENADNSSKRPRAEGDDTRRSKRPRVEEIQPTPPRPDATKITTKRDRVCKPIYSNYMYH